MRSTVLLALLLAMLFTACLDHGPTGPTAQDFECIDRPTNSPVASTCK